MLPHLALLQQTGLFARPGGTPGGVGGQNYANAVGDLTKMLVRDQTIRSHKLSLDNSQPQTLSVKRSRAQVNQSRFTSAVLICVRRFQVNAPVISDADRRCLRIRAKAESIARNCL